jgi:hypothetical protein
LLSASTALAVFSRDMTDSLLGELPLFERASQVLTGSRRENTSFADRIRNFCDFGRMTQERLEGSIPYLVNEFWTAGQRQAHSIHEVSYRACFKPQLPEFFIERLTDPGDGVYDPFMGRGTTLVQAALMGRRPMGNDINPLSVLLTRPRLRPPTLSEVARRLDEIEWSDASDEGDTEQGELLAFFSPRTLRQISVLRRRLTEHAPIEGRPDPIDDWIRMVAINRLTGHSPGFFSVYTLPPNQAVSAEAQRKINEKRGQTPPDRDVKRLILRKSASLLSDGAIPAHPEAQLNTGPAHATRAIALGSAKLVVTSPPFLDVVQYPQDNWLRCWFAGIDLGHVAMPQHRTEGSWQNMVRDTLIELARILAPGGHMAFEVGEVRNGKLFLERLVWDAAEGLPFDRLFVMVNDQAFTKTANCWGVSNNAKGTNSNRIVVMRRR